MFLLVWLPLILLIAGLAMMVVAFLLAWTEDWAAPFLPLGVIVAVGSLAWLVFGLGDYFSHPHTWHFG
jgi:uncharacterized membrane protein YgdD (TMEM256/DUF423 family)